MADQAAILINKRIVKLNGLSELRFSYENGYLYGFTVTATQTKYIHLVEDDAKKTNLKMFQQSIPAGYYSESAFFKYQYDNDLQTLLTTNFDDKFKPVEIGDIIILKKIQLFSPFTEPEFEFGNFLNYRINFNDQELFDNNGDVILPQVPEPEITSMNLGLISKNFYTNNIQYVNLGNDDIIKFKIALSIANIAISIDNIRTVVYPLFQNNVPQFFDLKNNQDTYWSSGIFEDITFYNEIFDYELAIYNFYRYTVINKIKIQEVVGYEKLYWLTLGLSVNSIRVLSPLNKIALLSWIQKNVRLGQRWFLLNDNEELVIKIINSIDEDQADLFLEQLFHYSEENRDNLFERLTDEKGFLNNNVIDDSTMGVGTDNKYNFIMSLFSIWQISSFNPYKDEIFSETNLNQFIYNNELGCNPDIDNNIFVDTFNLNPLELNFNASPISFNYQSTSSGGFFIDNFYFRSTNVRGDMSVSHWDNLGTDFRDFNNLNEAPKNKVLAFQKEYRKNGKDGLYGTYDYLQSVSLIDINQSASIKIEVVNGTAGNNSDINNLIPIFLLKYIDDKNLSSNIETTVSYLIDVASLWFGGSTLLNKYQYLRKVSVFSQPIIEGNVFGTQVLIRLYFTVGIEIVNFTAASLSLLCKIITNSQNANHPWLIKLKEVLMWIEIFSGVGSLAAESILRKKTKLLVDDFNENDTWPAEFFDDSRGFNAQIALQRVAYGAENLTQFANKQYEKIVVKLRNRIGVSEGSFQIKHFELEFNEVNLKSLIEEVLTLEREVGIKIFSRKFIEDFVIMSCRPSTDKKFTYIETLTMLRYYVKVTLPKGFCTGFHNIIDYKLFCNKFKNYTDNFFYDLNLNIDKYEVQGSVLFKHHPGNPPIPASSPTGIIPLTRGNPPIILTPEDFDGRMLISASDGKKVANYLKKYWEGKKLTLDKRNFSKQRWQFIQNIDDIYIDKQLKKGMLNKSILPIEYVNGLKTAVKNNGADIFLPLNKKGISEVGGAFVIKGSSYDILPVMEFKY